MKTSTQAREARRVQVRRLVPVARLDSAWAGVSYGMYQVLHEAWHWQCDWQRLSLYQCRSLIQVDQGEGCWQCCFKFRTVVRPSTWYLRQNSDIKIGKWGRPWLVWYVLGKLRCVPRFTKLKHRHRHLNDRRWRCERNSLSRDRSVTLTVTVSRWTARRYFHCLRRTIARITDKIIVTIPCIDPADLSINISD